MSMTKAQFDACVDAALDEIPQDLLDATVNVAITIEDEPPADQPELLGLYQGVPLPERTDSYAAGSIPDKITIYRGPLTRMCPNDTELRNQITITVVHELGHHFGIDDDRLHELGWG